MSNVTVHTDREETNYIGTVTVTDGGVLKVSEESGGQVWYSPAGWNWLEMTDGESPSFVYIS
jgi:hypothetical protein